MDAGGGLSGLWDAQNGATTEEGAFALSRPLQAGAFNYTLNRDSDEDWYLRSENAYRAEVPCMPPC